MKYILLILLLLTGVEGYSQSSTIGFIPSTKTVVLCTDNINLTTEYSPFGLYTMWGASDVLSPSDYRYAIPDTWGVNVGLFQNGLNIGAGGTILWLSNGDDYKIIPNVLIRFHPLKTITQDNRITDISFMLNISQGIHFGIGLSFSRLLNAF
ncbi:hypothetical protein N9P74_00600 [bacterium]|nr:hypothetical protein [bacterium]MDB4277981.1 hypothetical protein [Gammaproteobacteria bacterium]